jgi:zinc-ribbon domain
MSNPEIDRRCPACGASARQHAAFCPQCGKPIDHQEALAETMDLRRPEPVRSALESADTIAIDAADTLAINTQVPELQPVKPPSVEDRPSIPSASSLPGTRTSDTPHADNARGRVERLRKASSVVIDQAAFDPSLRFLLVSVAVFVLFVVLLILSKMIR